MERVRKPFQGVANIVRFNWHFYLGAGFLLLAGAFLSILLSDPAGCYVQLGCALVALPVVASLAVSFYVYDLSDLYRLEWLEEMTEPPLRLANIHAGFDETSALLRDKFPRADLAVLDFYDPAKHTEVSVERARKAYPAFPGTRRFATEKVPFADASLDLVVVFFAAHEIRDDEERVLFFRELNRVLKETGEVVVTEHVRDLPNFFAYNVGSFHFLSKRTWYRTFARSGFTTARERKHAVFVTTFHLRKHGNPA